MVSQPPDRPSWPSIASHLDLLARNPEQPFTPADVERAYAFLFLPFLDYEAPTVRARLFRQGLALAIDQLPDPEQRVLCKHLLLHEGHAKTAARRRLALAELSHPPYTLGGVTDEATLARIEPRALENLARILTSESFADQFRAHFAGRVTAQPPPPPPRRIMDTLSYSVIASLRDEPEPFLRRVTAIRARSVVDGLRVIALPFLWLRPVPPEPHLFPLVDVLTESRQHSFLGFRPDPRPNSEDWFVAIFHLGPRQPAGHEFKLVYRETWADFAPNAKENNLAFSVHGQALRHVHLSARLPPELKPRRFRGKRFDTVSARAPEQLPVRVYPAAATLRVTAPSLHGRYALDWVDDAARPMLE
jgi:hypothetical protein